MPRTTINAEERQVLKRIKALYDSQRSDVGALYEIGHLLDGLLPKDRSRTYGNKQIPAFVRVVAGNTSSEAQTDRLRKRLYELRRLYLAFDRKDLPRLETIGPEKAIRIATVAGAAARQRLLTKCCEDNWSWSQLKDEVRAIKRRKPDAARSGQRSRRSIDALLVQLDDLHESLVSNAHAIATDIQLIRSSDERAAMAKKVQQVKELVRKLEGATFKVKQMLSAAIATDGLR